MQAAQLAAQSGTVRCGKCGELFNGVAALVERTEEGVALEPSPQLGLFDPSRRLTQPPARDDAPPPRFMAEPRAPRTRLWALLALLALAALAGQVVHRYRAEVAAMLPAAREPLRFACRAALGCEVPLPRRPELMSIDSSELQADARREGLIALNAVIHNRAGFAQEYPSLELTLTDEADRPVVRRVLAPLDYLDARGRPLAAQGIAPGAEASVRVFLDTSRVRATGYRLYLFYPS